MLLFCMEAQVLLWKQVFLKGHSYSSSTHVPLAVLGSMHTAVIAIVVVLM